MKGGPPIQKLVRQSGRQAMGLGTEGRESRWDLIVRCEREALRMTQKLQERGTGRMELLPDKVEESTGKIQA